MSTSTVSAAEFDTPCCLGKETSIVGTPDQHSIRGTTGGDVIVDRYGSFEIFGLGGDDRICVDPYEGITPRYSEAGATTESWVR